MQVPDMVYPAPATCDESPLSSSLPERWQSAAGGGAGGGGTSTRHAPRVYYSNSEDCVTAADDQTRAIVPSQPYSSSTSPAGSPRLRRQPTRETRRLSVTETDEGWTQLNQYKLKDEIGKVGLDPPPASPPRSRLSILERPEFPPDELNLIHTHNRLTTLCPEPPG